MGHLYLMAQFQIQRGWKKMRRLIWELKEGSRRLQPSTLSTKPSLNFMAAGIKHAGLTKSAQILAALLPDRVSLLVSKLRSSCRVIRLFAIQVQRYSSTVRCQWCRMNQQHSWKWVIALCQNRRQLTLIRGRRFPRCSVHQSECIFKRRRSLVIASTGWVCAIDQRILAEFCTLCFKTNLVHLYRRLS